MLFTFLPRQELEDIMKRCGASYTERNPKRHEVADGFAVDVDDETRGTKYYDHIWK